VSRGRRAGGGRGDAKAVGRQASSGGRSSRGSGDGIAWTMTAKGREWSQVVVRKREKKLCCVRARSWSREQGCHMQSLDVRVPT